jgi:uncharacterized protein YkwD
MKKLVLFLCLYPFTFLFSQSEIKNMDIQSEFLKLLNDYRISEKLNTVVLSEDLRKASKILSDYYCSVGIEKEKQEDGSTKLKTLLKHGHPGYEKYKDLLMSVNPDLTPLFIYERNKENLKRSNFYVTENIALYGGQVIENSPKEISERFFRSWKNSLPHRFTMLEEDVTQIGITVSYIDVEYDDKVIKYDGKVFPPKEIVTLEKSTQRIYFVSVLFLNEEK